MLNLLLREDRHWLRKEYFLRISIVLVSTLIILAIVWGIVLTTSYAQIFVEKQIVEGQVEDIKNSDVTKERNELRDLSRDIEFKMEYLSQISIKPTFIIAAALDSQPAGVGLSEIVIQISDASGEVTGHIEMRGVADSRNNLVSFQKSLLAKELFNKVDVPFSNFAKDIEVPFTISISTVELSKYLENQFLKKEEVKVEEDMLEILKEFNIQEDDGQ